MKTKMSSKAIKQKSKGYNCRTAQLLRFCATALIFAILAFSPSCAPKESGGGDDDSTDGEGVTSYSFYLNMVSTSLKDFTPKKYTIYNSSGDKLNVRGIAVYDVISSIQEFSADADKFTYDFINFYEESLSENLGKSNLPKYQDLKKAIFYECEGVKDLCVGWTENKPNYHIANMNSGYIVTVPIEGELSVKSLEYVNEWEDDTPKHLSETIWVKGAVTVGTKVIVDGSYLKTFIQENDYGLKIFADTNATRENQGYDGQKMKDIETFEGDELLIKGRITLHDGMIEFVPISGYHVIKLSINNPVPNPINLTIDELIDAKKRYLGVLVRLDDVEIVDVNPDNPATDWPPYGKKSKEITIRHTSGGPKINLRIYEGTGIPGSTKPDAGFDLVGVPFVEEAESALYGIYVRKIEDINPTDEKLKGTITIYINGEDKSKKVNLADLQACMYKIDDASDAVPVVSIASIVSASGITRNPKKLKYKHISFDDRKPFDSLTFDQLKSGILYQDVPQSEEEPNPMVSSHFWEGMNLSDIYYLRGVTKVEGFREVKPPEEGEAEHGKGITLVINGKKYAVNFDSVPHTKYDGKDAIELKELVPDNIVELYTMDGSFTTEQIKVLYDYHLVSWDETDETLVRWSDFKKGYLIMEDPPYTFFEHLGSNTKVDDLYWIEMWRYIQVDKGDGSEPVVVYLKDCETEPVDVGGGVIEEVVFYKTILEEAGIDTSKDMYLYDFWLTASDDFTSYWTFRHNHLEDMYFRPNENKGYTVDEDLAEYGGRVSTKAVYEISMHEVPQQPPSIPVKIGGKIVWGSDANSCEGCHFKNGQVKLPINCYSCHASP